MGPVIKNSVTPPVTHKATIQSRSEYLFPEIAIPHTITGIILKLFPSICTGKETYFNASYWQVLAPTLENEIAKYFQKGAALTKFSPLMVIMTSAKAIAIMRLQKTRKTDVLKRSSPYGMDMIRSCKRP